MGWFSPATPFKKPMKLAWDPKDKVDKHDGTYQRERSADPYHSYKWTRLSRIYRASFPLCAECRRNNIIKAAEVVDHIIPWPVCEDFFDTTNLQSLCQDCNRTKGNKDKKLIAQWRKTHPNQ